MNRRFVTADVFTDTPLAGNPLAVVLEAEGLDGARMQAIAREFNLSETVFVLPPADDRHRARLRIFTPAAELPFAGHPIVGAAAVLGIEQGGGDQIFGLEVEAGITPCVTEARGDGRSYARFRAPRVPEKLAGKVAPEDAAAALGLDADDIGETAKWSAGTPFDLIELASMEALAKARPNAQFTDFFPAAFLFVRVEGWMWWRARMFAPALGIAEDPATGSAAAAFAGLVHGRALPGEGDHDIVVEQGVEMGRPSKIAVQLVCRGVRLEGVEIGGDVVVMSEGKLRV
ncbi:MAG TPA: PhzF family phenazine biosynthesis protein [Caulobacterales bacterium]|nr:PhzF family phenazine biosynthesis protein [Caulobacterales bacterium]